jgi:multidrug efflux system membrane fusion protein
MLTAGACSKRQADPPPPPASVKTAQAVKMDAPIVVTAFGTTEAMASVDIVPQVSGLLLKCLFRDGAVVTNGQPLFLIDPRDYEARVQQAQGLVAADRANLALMRLTLDRNQDLVAKELISKQDFDTLKTKAAAAEAQLQADEAMLEQARLNLARCTLAAPLAGVCSRRYLDEGNLVTAGVTRLTNIRSYDPLTIECSVSEQYLSVLRQALAKGKVRIDVVPSGGTNSTQGTLTFLDNTVNPQTGTILLRGEVPNADLTLWSRQFVGVRIVAGVRVGAVMVPESAVQFGKLGSYLFAVSAENRAEMRPVKTGVRVDGRIEIEEGVAEGEKVVVLGQMKLYPGAPVAELPPQPPSAAPPAAGGRP